MEVSIGIEQKSQFENFSLWRTHKSCLSLPAAVTSFSNTNIIAIPNNDEIARELLLIHTISYCHNVTKEANCPTTA